MTINSAIKYAGADWLSKTFEFDRQQGRSLSPFGVRVANVLGQVYQGIYHIDDAVLNKSVQWDSSKVISVTVYGQLASYDFGHLTALVLCCHRAGIEANIQGSFRGYTKLVFVPVKDSNPVDFTLQPCFRFKGDNVESLKSLVAHHTDIKKTLYQDESRPYTEFSTTGLPWPNLQYFVATAHHNCIRVSVEGQSPHSLRVTASKRKSRTGSIYERHPTLEGHKAILEPYVGIDYESLS